MTTTLPTLKDVEKFPVSGRVEVSREFKVSADISDAILSRNGKQLSEMIAETLPRRLLTPHN